MFSVVAHDAGGAEILSSYIRQECLDCYYVLEGPACNIFERKLGVTHSSLLMDVVFVSEFILCGTGWDSDLEFNAIQLARKFGKKSIAFLDHWSNYKERFIRNNKLCLPDEIWVGDSIAEAMAKDIFPTLPVHKIDNPYFHEIRQELDIIPQESHAGNILYVCEPIREHALKQHGDERYWGYTEEDALRYFLTHVHLLNRKIQRITIRLHPSESQGKYDSILQEFSLPIEIGVSSLIEEVSACEVVAGCQSMAMVVGLLAAKKVISVIPPGGAPCVLPQEEIIHLQKLVETANATY